MAKDLMAATLFDEPENICIVCNGHYFEHHPDDIGECFDQWADSQHAAAAHEAWFGFDTDLEEGYYSA